MARHVPQTDGWLVWSVLKTATVQGDAALADPTRESIVRLLLEGQRSAGEIAERLPVSRPAVSERLRVLDGDRTEVWVHYRGWDVRGDDPA